MNIHSILLSEFLIFISLISFKNLFRFCIVGDKYLQVGKHNKYQIGFYKNMGYSNFVVSLPSDNEKNNEHMK